MATQQSIEPIVGTLQGEERGLPGVNDTGPTTAKRGLILVSLLMILCAAIGIGYWKYKKNLAKESQGAVRNNLQITSTVPARTFTEPPSVPPPSPRPELGPAPALAGAPPLPDAAMGRSGSPSHLLDKAGSSLMAVGGKQDRSGSSLTAVGASSSTGGSGGPAQNPVDGGSGLS